MSRRAYSSVHLNGNLLCAVDTETTGLIPGYHDIIQVAIIPLNPDYTPQTDKAFPFFHMKLTPKNMDRADLAALEAVDSKTMFVDACNNGMDPWAAVERFDEWFQSLQLPMGKGIVPLGHNYLFDKDFITDWLGGPQSYRTYFRSDVRDTFHLAASINDMCEWKSEAIPFPKMRLGALCRRLGVQLPNAHDAMADALASAECYRRMLNLMNFLLPFRAEQLTSPKFAIQDALE
jgi:DNA polymerase III epsilon subunit-like protein